MDFIDLVNRNEIEAQDVPFFKAMYESFANTAEAELSDRGYADQSIDRMLIAWGYMSSAEKYDRDECVKIGRSICLQSASGWDHITRR